jgi:hypothetical protein
MFRNPLVAGAGKFAAALLAVACVREEERTVTVCVREEERRVTVCVREEERTVPRRHRVQPPSAKLLGWAAVPAAD